MYWAGSRSREQGAGSRSRSSHLLLDPGHMFAINLVQWPKVVARVSSAPQGTLVADTLPAGALVHLDK